MRLTHRQHQTGQEPELTGPDWRKRELARQLWRIDWKRQGYDFCGIYCVSPDNRWPTKVGVSQNPSKRLISLQTSCWKRLDIAEYRYSETALVAREVEKKAHSHLKEDGKLLEGEWFDIRPEKAIEIVEFAAVSLGVVLRSDIPDDKIREALENIRQLQGIQYMETLHGENFRPY